MGAAEGKRGGGGGNGEERGGGGGAGAFKEDGASRKLANRTQEKKVLVRF